MVEKDWFESMFDTDDENDKWGHQYRATQKHRLNYSFELLIKHINRSHLNIGDVCCGLGDFLSMFKNKQLYGYDISNTAVEKAKNKFHNIQFSQNELPNVPKNLDVIVALECLYYIDINEAVKSINQNLNDDGLFLVSVATDYIEELRNSMYIFDIIEEEYLYYGLFSKIEPKLLFYIKDLDYIIQRKEVRGKFLLKKLLNSKVAYIVKIFMKLVQKISFLILKSDLLVSISTFARIKSHIIVLGKKK
jgi:SAM-dependent methyltransferase